MTFVDVLFILTAQSILKSNHISDELPESHLRLISEKAKSKELLVFMSKWDDCQINSSLTPPLISLSLCTEALHAGSINIKAESAHVIGAEVLVTQCSF